MLIFVYFQIFMDSHNRKSSSDPEKRMLQCDNSLTSLDTVTSPLTDCPESTEEEHSSCVGRQDVEEQGRDGEDDLKGISVEHNAEAFGETTTVLTLQ